jgi:AraC-like DNA-binding protein
VSVGGAPAPATPRLALLPSAGAAIDVSVHDVEVVRYPAVAEALERPDWVISHVVEGCVETETRGTRAEARSGQVMVHPARLPFSERSAGPGVHEWIGFDAVVAPSVELFRLHPVPLVVTLVDPAEFSRSFHELRRTWVSPPDGARPVRVVGLALQLCAMVLEGWERAGRPARAAHLHGPSDRFDVLIRHMEDHMAERITRDDLARLVHLHPGSLDRAFAAACGMSPLQMLREMRLRRARAMVEGGDDPFERVAATCGFGDAAHFSRAFRARYGMPPGELRRRASTARASYIRP